MQGFLSMSAGFHLKTLPGAGRAGILGLESFPGGGSTELGTLLYVLCLCVCPTEDAVDRVVWLLFVNLIQVESPEKRDHNRRIASIGLTCRESMGVSSAHPDITFTLWICHEAPVVSPCLQAAHPPLWLSL